MITAAKSNEFKGNLNEAWLKGFFTEDCEGMFVGSANFQLDCAVTKVEHALM